MKMAKSYKIILLLAAFVMSVVMAFGFLSTVSADTTTVSPENYFTFSEGVTAKFENDALLVDVVDGGKITFKNKIAINNAEFTLDIPDGAKATITLESNSLFVNGNKNADGKFDKLIKNKIVLEDSAITLNEDAGIVELDNGVHTVWVKSDSVGLLTVNGAKNNLDTEGYYRLNTVGGIIAANVSIEIDLPDGATDKTLKIISVDQYAGVDGYKQTFVLTEGKLTHALPRIAIDKDFYTRTDLTTYKAVKLLGEEYTLDMTAYSVLDTFSDSDIYLAEEIAPNADAKVTFESGTKTPDALRFRETGDVTFIIKAKVDGTDKVCESVVANVVDADTLSDENAPEYKNNELALEAFEAALKEQYEVKETVDEQEVITSAPLGTSLEIPSLEDLVFDNYTPYSELSLTVHYRSASTSSTAKEMEFKLDEVGGYRFFVTFEDKAGNAMESDDFIKIDEDDDNKIDPTAKYRNFVFFFNINDDANIEVKAPIPQGIGYKGITYTASKFNIDASGCNMTYVLYYNEDVNATDTSDGWKVIPKASTVTDTEFVSEDGFTYDDVKEFAYDGNLTFVPKELGAYKIVCTATSSVSPRTAEAHTIIKVESEPAIVKVPSTWLADNVWSVVFLSIGTLCLIGIIVLLFIKPKEETDND